MKNRLPALDGLRGFAALSVVLSHTGYSPALLTTSPLVLSAYNTLAVGPNSVQILFVLSGFLMAFLYPSLPSAAKFIQKRYARIFPVYGFIVIFLWLVSVSGYLNNLYSRIVFLGILALIISLGWTHLKKYSRFKHIGKYLFYTFVILQTMLLLMNLFITPRFVVSSQLLIPEFAKSILIMLSNLTLTTPFVKDVPRMSGVFWSLAPEVLFYLVYPFVVIPLIYVGRNFGKLVTIILIICTTKILFDLDTAVSSIGGFHSMNIARSSGFIAGVVIGTIYQSKGALWNKILPIIKNPFFCFLSIILFIAIQWGDGAIRNGQSISLMNFYYLLSSWVVALLIMTAVIPQTITYKIFSNKIFVFLGLISYSLYLIHIQLINWTHEAISPLEKYISSQKIFDLFAFILVILISVGIAAFLYRTIEFLYFASKKKVLETTLASESEKVEKTSQSFSKRRIIITAIISSIVFFFLYAGSYSPTQLISRTKLTGFEKQEQSILGESMIIPFQASNNNLSAVYINLRYAKSAGETLGNKNNPAELQFILSDENGDEIFASTRSAYMVEGTPLFGFGFPTIAQSEGKRYTAKLSLDGGDPKDQVLVDTSPTSFVSIYTTSKAELIRNPFTFIFNRIIFVFSNPGFLFFSVFILVLTLSPFVHKYIKRK